MSSNSFLAHLSNPNDAAFSLQVGQKKFSLIQNHASFHIFTSCNALLISHAVESGVEAHTHWI